MAAANISKNDILCHACAEEVKDEYVPCQGFCNAVFHLNCSSTKQELLKDIAPHRQIFWLCRSCTNLMVDLRHRRSIQCAFEAGQELSLSHHNRIVEQLKSELLSELKSELTANFKKLIASNSLTPKSGSLRTAAPRGSSGRRLFDQKPAPRPRPDPLPPKPDTGKPEESSSVGKGLVAEGYGPRVSATDDDVPRFWLYLSRVSRNVTEEQIAKLAVDRLGVEDVRVKRLVAKGKDVSRMRFISFKVGVHVDLKHKALSSATWPDGLVFREFEERNTEFFWEPPTTPVTKPTTSNSLSTSVPVSTPKNAEQAPKDAEEISKNPDLISKEAESTSPAGQGGSPMDHQAD